MGEAARKHEDWQLPSQIPDITCPACSRHMMLSTIEPPCGSRPERMTFRCDCGFEYYQSNIVGAERAL
ncbi:MAG: hypothetical protein JO254_03830 [Pseudolabrys sp.]|nr:hypothetical protein [Pseudolabrys sp.]